jgi:hypothetical protein
MLLLLWLSHINEKKPLRSILFLVIGVFFYLTYTCTCIYQGCCFTSRNLFADTNKRHTLLISDVECIYIYVVESNRSREPEEE